MDTQPSFQHAHVSHVRMALCEQDSPMFRAALQRAADELDELLASLDAVSKGARGVMEHAVKGQETLARTLVYVRRICGLDILSVSPQALCTLIAIAELTVLLHERVISNTAFKAFTDSYTKIADAVSRVRLARKASEKSREKFESFHARFSALPRLREQPLVREDAHYLLECRKLHMQHLVGYVQAVQAAQAVVEACLSQAGVSTLSEAAIAGMLFCDALRALQTPMAVFKDLVSVKLQKSLQEWTASEEKVGQELLAHIRVRTVLDYSTEMKRNVAGLAKAATGLQPYREGYVNVRRQKGLGAIWRRVYLILQPAFPPKSAETDTVRATSCMLLQQSVAPRACGVVETAFAINVLLIEARIHSSSDNDRRFCFEIATARKSLLYQGESDEDVREWMNAITRAKNDVMFVQNNSSNLSANDANNTEHLDPASPPESGAQDSFTYMPEGQVAVPATMIEEAPGTFARALDVFKEFSIAKSLETTETVVLNVPVLIWSVKESDGDALPVLGRIVATNEKLYAVSAVLGRKSELSVPWKRISDVKIVSDSYLHVSSVDKSFVMRLQVLCSSVSNIRESMLLLARNARLSRPRLGSQLVAMLQPGAEEDPQLSFSQLSDALPIDGNVNNDTAPIIEADCGCTSHLEQIELNITVPLPVDEFFELILGNNSPVFSEMNVRRGHRDVSISAWTEFSSLDGSSPNTSNTPSQVSVICSDSESGVQSTGSSSSSNSSKSAKSLSHVHLVDSNDQADVGIQKPNIASRTSDTKNISQQSICPSSTEPLTLNSGQSRVAGRMETNLPETTDSQLLKRPSEAIAERSVKFYVPVNNPLVKARETVCYARHWLLRRERGAVYIVRQEARTPDITYGDSFTIVTQYCLTAAGSRQSRLRVCTGITWLRSPLVKGIIKSGIMRSQAEYFKIYTTVLWPAIRSKLESSGAAIADIEKMEQAKSDGNEPLSELATTGQAKGIAGKMLAVSLANCVDLLLKIKALLGGSAGTEASALGILALILGILLGVFCSAQVLKPKSAGLKSFPVPVVAEFDRWMSAKNPTHIVPISSAALEHIGRLESAYSIVRDELEKLETGLRQAECRVLQSKYATWLASELVACYSDMWRKTSHCKKFADLFEKATNARLCALVH